MNERFLVAGLGAFGRQAALALANGGGVVLAVDIDDRAVDAVKDHVARAICCDATDEHAMEAVGAYDVDVAVIAIRRAFDIAVLTTHSLQMRRIPKILVQVDSERQGDAILAVGATEVIIPHRDIAIRTANRLLHGNLVEMLPLDKNIAVVEWSCPGEFAGRDLRALDLRRKWGISVLAVQRAAADRQESGATLVNPPADTVLHLGDNLVLMGAHEHLVRVSRLGTANGA
ncbi:TrkA-N domain protein [Magnetococcus marinus MC-1]|uniref:TrkA-N domain protein n=1 Tax=Magnetococcus marinus (strain ATCC BAA-1437 / JCM 17883 / MC-1) TaxID=156889 RepID=A0LDP5_MAGMM|nr:TrkA family potassium uptake protein [Magnetococcus marinus]ABK46088.1 TrkA-N domain protein [Magnetococcus marinus MC-1]